MRESELDRLLDALLFVADGPVGVEDLARTLEIDRGAIDQAVGRLMELNSTRGTSIVRLGSQVQMVTAPDAGPVIERFLGLNVSAKLSSAAMETLAIVAYRQPITRAEIESIRGVNSEGVLRTLLAKSLVASMGRLDQAGRPILFGTTFEFLSYLGIRSLEELPRLPDLEDDSLQLGGTMEAPTVTVRP